MSGGELRAASLGVDVGGRVLFDGVSFVVRAGETLVVTGASGSGKTILAHTLAGVSEPDRGEVTLSGRALRDVGALEDRPALVTQDFGLVSFLTAEETVSLPLQVRSLAKDEIRERAARWLGALGLDACAQRPVGDLSGGQRQRVAIARAMARESPIIVMDEPTAELDPTNRAILLTLLAGEQARGAAIVIVSHDDDVIARADALYALAKLR